LEWLHLGLEKVCVVNQFDRINGTLSDLAKSIAVPCDIITVHRDHSLSSRTQPFQSLRYGAFLLAVVSLDAFFTNASGFAEQSPGRSIGIRPDRVRESFDKNRGYPNINHHWKARARVASERIDVTYKRAPWYLFEGSELRDYLEDLNDARNVLAHGKDKSKFTNRSGALHPLKAGGASIRLMTVEGTIQAIEDIASQTALTMIGDDARIPEWPSPRPTKHSATARLPRPY
jgi:hypothetical protein